MGARDIKRPCSVNDDAEKLLETAINKLGLKEQALGFGPKKLDFLISSFADSQALELAIQGRPT